MRLRSSASSESGKPTSNGRMAVCSPTCVADIWSSSARVARPATDCGPSPTVLPSAAPRARISPGPHPGRSRAAVPWDAASREVQDEHECLVDRALLRSRQPTGTLAQPLEIDRAKLLEQHPG